MYLPTKSFKILCKILQNKLIKNIHNYVGAMIKNSIER